MALVLAIEPDLRQAAIVKRIVREKVFADVAVVDSREAALEAMRTTVPDVLLLSALLSPRDEDELIAHLRTLDNADHLQTHTIPQLASALGPDEGRVSRGLLSAFRRKKKEPEAPPTGCDPDIFAEEIRSYIARAADAKRERLEAQTHSNAEPQDNTWRTAPHSEKAKESVAETAPLEEPAGSSWSSPFEWKPSNPSSLISNPYSRVMSDDEQAGSAIDALGTAAQASENLELAPDIFMQDIFVPDFAAAAPAPVGEEPMLMVVEPTATEEAFHLMDPVYVETPVFSEPPVYVDTPIDLDASLLDDDVDVDAPVFVGRTSASTDSEGTTPDVRLEISDRRLGPLATWVRTDLAPISMSASGDDLRSMLGGLAVPNAVAAVGYPRGVRIRRVRVPAAREPRVTEGAGAVILSKRLLAEQRELRDQPRA